jgi:hypothetical protein
MTNLFPYGTARMLGFLGMDLARQPPISRLGSNPKIWRIKCPSGRGGVDVLSDLTHIIRKLAHYELPEESI